MKKFVDTLLTLGKVALKSRPVGKARGKKPGGSLIVMGNGPSLRDTLRDSRGVLLGADTMAVNFAANAPEYFELRPRHYVLADPHFFTSGDPSVSRLWRNLASTDWDMTLHLPVRATLPAETARNPRIAVRRFNMTPGEGYDVVCHLLFGLRLAMPRPRNVLIPALMQGIGEGYSRIYIVGADHTWPHTLYVDDDNRVVTVQPHFYEEKKEELDRIAEVYKGVRIHDILGSMATAFRSYHDVARYAETRGVEIVNATPGSLIDAFPRLGGLPSSISEP